MSLVRLSSQPHGLFLDVHQRAPLIRCPLDTRRYDGTRAGKLWAVDTNGPSEAAAAPSGIGPMTVICAQQNARQCRHDWGTLRKLD
jgi:hypothetical protein